ncbi:MAG: hypothetical protein Q4B85_08180 [Lachnospiraceae bacterium]|nr:hypothetical protein [Lachnospiraceae bacterium]
MSRENLPPWTRVLEEAHLAGYRAIELGPYGYLPIDIDAVSAELNKNDLAIVAGTIFDDLVSEENYENVLKAVDDICSLITKLPMLPVYEGQHFPTPYMTVMDWGHDRWRCRKPDRLYPSATTDDRIGGGHPEGLFGHSDVPKPFPPHNSDI